MTTQTCPGTIQLATLASGLNLAASVSFAKMEGAAGSYNNSMSIEAANQENYGQQMIDTMPWLNAIQAVAIVVMAGSVVVPVLAKTVTAGTSILLNGLTQAAQGATNTVMGVMQFYKSGLQAKTQISSAATPTFGKISENDVNTIKAEAQGAQKIGTALSTMLFNEGAVMKQKNV